MLHVHVGLFVFVTVELSISENNVSPPNRCCPETLQQNPHVLNLFTF